MTFSSAIDIWVRSPEKKLRRSSWSSEKQHVVFRGRDARHGAGRLEIFSEFGDCYLGYSPNDDDLFSDDWQEVAS